MTSGSRTGEHYECVAAAFHRQVRLRPDKVAVWDATGSVTFSELWRQASRVARALRAEGVLPGTAVGLLGTGSRESILAMLGVLLTGAHVVPADPDYPSERVQRITALAGVRLVLVADDHRLPAGPGLEPRRVRDLAEKTEDADADELPGGSPESPAYVLFTSGSTGTPKGVAVPQGALTALCLREGPTRMDAEDVFLVHTILTFDPSMLEIWSALLAGAAVLCAPRSSLSLSETAGLLLDERVTTAVLTPAIFALMVDRYPEALAGLRRLIVGGDVMPLEQAVRVRRHCPDLDVVNCYGPTENTIVSTALPLRDWDGSGTSVPIGTAVAGTTCHILDENLRPLGPGEVGELYVGGDRLACGYLGDPELTRQRFVPDPTVDDPSARLYRTGDLASLRADGLLEFHGRTDHEVKVRGFRVNLAEVEAVISADPEVSAAVAVPAGTGHERRIRAFARPIRPGVDPKAVRARLAGRVPAYLVPDDLVLVTVFPLQGTGKVDREALAALADDSRPAEAEAGETAAGDEVTLARMWARRTGTPASSGEDFFSAGGSSLDLIRLIDDVAETFGAQLTFEDVYGVRSFGELLSMVRDRRTVSGS
ncbi:non-ribosomal peptide synthetase [Nonomuraea typhae]|uniref:Non-ribosomal peptide synthetase n=1 Tax=Nonomuraea typhae TaxID=2603600 RepID=A0ABW7Z8I1_9ACTN